MSRDLQDALEGIEQIRSQIARSIEFKGYGWATVAASGLLAWIAAGLQSALIPDPTGQFADFLLLWSAAAFLSVCLVGAEMAWRARRHHVTLAPDLVRTALGQFLPAGIAGALLTFVLMRAPPDIRALVPGLWQILFSLGIFASTRYLPTVAYGAAVWYLAAGLVNLGAPLSPWSMSIPFGIGQFLLAAALWREAKP